MIRFSVVLSSLVGQEIHTITQWKPVFQIRRRIPHADRGNSRAALYMEGNHPIKK